MSATVHLISSMATRALLVELASDWPVRVESAGGVDVARRVEAGEPFDVVVLASDAIERLTLAGCLVADSRTDLVRSDVAIAVPRGAPPVSVADATGLRAAIVGARRIALSGGPSGVALAALFHRWDLGDVLRERVVHAQPGVPVGRLLAQGEADLGFQQQSELAGLPGIDVLGTMPPGFEIVTTFSAARCVGSRAATSVAPMLAHWRSAATDEAKRRHGLLPARDPSGSDRSSTPERRQP